MRFFFDANVSPFLVDVLKFIHSNSERLVHHNEKFNQGTTDVQWLTDLGTEGNWIIISGDTRIISRPIEKVVWKKIGLTSIFLPESLMRKDKWEQSSRMLGWWPKLERFALHCRKGESHRVMFNVEFKSQPI